MSDQKPFGNTALKLAEENLYNFYDGFYKVYLNRWVYYEIPKGKMPEVLKFLDSIGLLFKPGEIKLKKLLGNFKGMEEEYKKLIDACNLAQDQCE